MRDNFSRATIKQLEKNAGNVCSYPLCRMVTRGSKLGYHGASNENIGQAAHITAASIGGPRFDPNLSKEQRSDISNGIWMCYTHGKYIDSASSTVTAEMLRKWKLQHEDDVRRGKICEKTTREPDTCQYIRTLTLENVGIFQTLTTFKFGRLNFLLGDNGSGKTTVSQLLCWLSGEVAGANAHRRFITSATTNSSMLKFEFGSKSSVCEFRYIWKKKNWKRLHFSVKDSSVENVLKVQSQFRSIYLDLDSDEYGKKSRRHNGLTSYVKNIACMLGVRHEDLLSLIIADGSRSTVVGYALKLSNDGNDILVSRGDPNFFQEFASLSGTEQALAMLDVALRCIDNIPATQGWLLIIESGIAEYLACRYDKLSEVVLTMPMQVQVLVCLHSKSTLKLFLKGHENEFANYKISKLDVVCSNTDLISFEETSTLQDAKLGTTDK